MNQYLADAIVGVLCVIVGIVVGAWRMDSYWKDQQAQTQVKVQKQLIQEQATNAAIAVSYNGALAAVSDLRAQIARARPQVEKIYVKVPVKANQPTPAPQAVSGAVYVAGELVRLFDCGADLSQATCAGSALDAAGSAASDFTYSDFTSAALDNGAACKLNTQQLILWQKWYKSLL